jgi:hypothetical protein
MPLVGGGGGGGGNSVTTPLLRSNVVVWPAWSQLGATEERKKVVARGAAVGKRGTDGRYSTSLRTSNTSQQQHR